MSQIVGTFVSILIVKVTTELHHHVSHTLALQ